ncbi:unnamed protein product [Prorocentrum cordatum]|uniref:Uncharacterized protein n=1 Tax=Prorocentrum cordatum TaxID=2364126 RepID=A0ABN9WQW3_9DINO|nr:unnamed protein product [Polarella glacialis]
MHYNVRAGRRGTAKSWASGVGATWRPSRASTNHQANLAQNKGAQNERIIIAFIRPQTEHDDPFRVRSRKTRAYDDWTKPQRKMDLSRHAAAAWGSPRRGRRLRFARPRRSSAQARNNKIKPAASRGAASWAVPEAPPRGMLHWHSGDTCHTQSDAFPAPLDQAARADSERVRSSTEVHWCPCCGPS